MSDRTPASSSTRRTVAIVGGGYAGITVAKALDDAAEVVLVDPRDAFVHNLASLRALVDPEWLPRIFFPYERLLANGRVVRGRAVSVGANRVVLESGAEIVADFIVLATGSTYPFPAKSDADDTATAMARYRATRDALAGAARVLLLGAGPVGIELAGEILTAWPDKQVTIVDPADDVLTGPYKPELRRELRRQLEGRGVHLLLSTTLAGRPDSEPGEARTFTATTQDGRSVTADIWFRCHGVRPTSDYLAPELASARTPDGFISVTPHLQVSGHPTVFALGDVSTIDSKMAGRAQKQAEVVAANIRTLIGGESALSSYTPFPPLILVPFGPNGGASQLPGSDEIAGAETTAGIKGQGLFTDRYVEMFGGTHES